MDSSANLKGAARQGNWLPDFQLAVAAGFAATGSPEAAVQAAQLAGQFAAAAGLPVDLLAEALALAYDRRGQGDAFGRYLVGMLAATAPPATEAGAMTAVLPMDRPAAAAAAELLAATEAVDGVAIGEVLFARKADVGDVTAVFEVTNAEGGPTAEVYLMRGRSLLCATPPAKQMAFPYRLQVGGRPFVVTAE